MTSPIDGAVIVDAACGGLWPDIERALRVHRPRRMDCGQMLRERGGAAFASTDIVVLAPRLTDGSSSSRLVEQLRQGNPQLTIYLCARDLREVTDIKAHAHAGTDQVHILGVAAEWQAFEPLVTARLSAPAPERELRVLAHAIRPARSRAIALHCVRNAFTLHSTVRLPAIFGCVVETMNSRLESVDLPTVAVVARCGRQFHVNELERRGVRPRDDIAHRCGFGHAASMRRQRDRLRETLVELGARGTLLLLLLGRRPRDRARE